MDNENKVETDHSVEEKHHLNKNSVMEHLVQIITDNLAIYLNKIWLDIKVSDKILVLLAVNKVKQLTHKV